MTERIADRYEIIAELGRGASATVYHARDTVLDRPVALKVLSSTLMTDPDFVARFEQEARLSARLHHPNIVTVHDVGTAEDGRAFIAMGLVEGEGLDEAIARTGRMSLDEAVPILRQLASALDYTHANGLIHRDVKPSNARIDKAGAVTLTDFGIARALDSARMTLPGLTIGTPRYMSPEQVRGAEVTAATDIYALAVIAFEMLTGQSPFEGDGTALMYKIVHEQPSSPRVLNPAISAQVAAVLDRGLAKAPEDRWPSAGAFVDALERAREPAVVPVDAPTQVSPALTETAAAPAAATAGGGGDSGGSKRGGFGTRGWLLALGGGAALFGAAYLFSIFALGGDDDDEPPTDDGTPTSEVTPGDDQTQEAAETQTAEADETPTRAPTRTPTPRPTAVVPTPTPIYEWSEITNIAVTGGFYYVQFKTGNYTPSLPNDMHVHFFYDTVPPEQAGSPGSGPWILYGGPSPFTEYSVASRPAGAEQMCILVANADHSVILDTGNCVDLP